MFKQNQKYSNYQKYSGTDASDIGLGKILMQERNVKPQLIAYGSRLCTAAERNYSITERETLAVIYYLEHFTDVILGYKIRVWTDHTTIQNLYKHKNLRGRLARWFMTLQNFEVNFEYILGKRIPQSTRPPEIFKQNQKSSCRIRNILAESEIFWQNQIYSGRI